MRARGGAERDPHRRERQQARARRAARAAARARRGASRAAPATSRRAAPRRGRRRGARAPPRSCRSGRTARRARARSRRARGRASRPTATARAASGQPGGKNGSAAAGPAGERGAEGGGDGALAASMRVGSVNRAAAAFVPRWREAAQLVGELARGRPLARILRERAIDEPQQPLRQLGPQLAERPRAGLDRARRLEHRAAPERMPSRERLPEHHADGPDVRRRRSRARRRAARARCTRAFRARLPARSASRRRPSARARSRARARRPAAPSASRTFDGLTSRWRIPAACACARPSQTCAHASIASSSVSSSGAQRLAERLAGDELVRDVDVPRVVREAVRAEAGRMAQARRGLGLALGARRGFPFARDDLERDVEARLLVAGEPDRAGAAAAERPERPVAAEDELGEGERLGGLSHALRRLATASDCPSRRVRLARRVNTLRRRQRARVLRGAGDARGARRAGRAGG